MTREALEAELQDYLDGGMSDGRRREFEARIAGDPALARRIRAYRTDAEALRSGTEALAPDFYARLRARFEAPRAAAPRWFRLASWEAAGLAAAVVVAAALFVPLFVGERPGPAAPTDAASRAPAREELRPSAAAEPPLKKRADPRDEARATREDRVVKAEAPAPPPASPSERQALEKASAADTGLGAQVAEEAPTAARAAPFARAGKSAQPSPAGITVPAGIVEPGASREIVERSEWEDLAGRADASAIGSFDPTRRIVLVGERDGGLDCSASSIAETAAGHVIRLAGARAGPPRDGHGCAFVLPRDGRPVRLDGPNR